MASKFSIPEYASTPVGDIPATARRVRLAFRTHKTKDIQWRLVQLRKFYWALSDLDAEMKEALHRDIRKSPYESELTEIDFLRNACMFMIDNLKSFAKDEKLGSPAVPLSFSMMNTRVRKEPIGAVLVIGAYNYPFQLLLGPLLGAVAAGCTAVVKPSELAPVSAMVIKEIVSRLDPEAFAVVNGAVPETTALLDEKWDKIMYTGSAHVGTIIAKKAAETLTPVCLELGGRNPAFVTKNANLALAARRLLWAKVSNAGQVCLSQNYILIDKDAVQPFVEHLKTSLKDFFPDGPKASPDLSRIINARHFQRIKNMLDSTKGEILVGGAMDEAELYIEPTVVLIKSMDDPMIREESFGPIFAIYPVNTLDEALNVANRVHRTPLALFTFGSKAENARGIFSPFFSPPLLSSSSLPRDSFVASSSRILLFLGESSRLTLVFFYKQSSTK